MPKDILIFGRVDEFNTRLLFDSIDAILDKDENADLNFRINTRGGEPSYGYSAVAKMFELPNRKKIKVDGDALSWGCYMCCYGESVECLDVSRFMIHRAAFAEWFEESVYFTDELKADLAARNSFLEKAFRNSIDVEAFENLKQLKEKGITIKDIFSMDSRIDVFFSAADAKKIGLVDKINKITPAAKAEIEARMEDVSMRIAAEYTGKKQTKLPFQVIEAIETTPVIESKSKTNMTLEELKAQHPAIFAQAKAEGEAAGRAAEKDRVDGILVYAAYDLQGCTEAIASGKNLTEKQKNEFSLKALSAESLKNLSSANAPVVGATAAAVEGKTTSAPAPAAAGSEALTAEQKAMDEAEAELDALLGLKK